MAEPYTEQDFHEAIRKQVAGAAINALVDAKLDWADVLPFIEAAQRLCRSDFETRARLRLHSRRTEGETVVEAEEAYLGIAVAGGRGDSPWLSHTRWLSQIALAESDPEALRGLIAAIERSLEKIRTGLAEREAEASGEKKPDRADEARPGENGNVEKA